MKKAPRLFLSWAGTVAILTTVAASVIAIETPRPREDRRGGFPHRDRRRPCNDWRDRSRCSLAPWRYRCQPGRRSARGTGEGMHPMWAPGVCGGSR
jgi:hypothetical protein